MKLVYMAAGAAGMYCGSCLHDNTLAATLLEQGIDVMLVPTYTPLRTDEESVSEHRVFFGGVNVYLQQKLALFRHTPAFFDRLLDSPALISWLAGHSVSTRPEDLGGLAVSMLQGEQGRQRKELKKLVDWLARDARPDVVHLSNSMLSGMARAIKRRLGVPVVCTLSGEDIFLESIPEPYYSRAREELVDHAADVDHFVALNNYYADFSADYLQVPRERIEVIPHGLRLDGHRATPPSDLVTEKPERTIGYLAHLPRQRPAPSGRGVSPACG
ncbi:MAG: glycosyltransferase [Pirellulales bacterium]